MIIYGLLYKEGRIVSEYGVSTKDYSPEVLKLIERDVKTGTKFFPLLNVHCAMLRKKLSTGEYTLVVLLEDKGERDDAFDFLDRVSSAYEEDQANSKVKDADAVISKHLRGAMETINSRAKGKGLKSLQASLNEATNTTGTTLSNLA